MSRYLGLSNDEIANTFEEWNKGDLDSYLIEITRDIFRKKDEETGKVSPFLSLQKDSIL